MQSVIAWTQPEWMLWCPFHDQWLFQCLPRALVLGRSHMGVVTYYQRCRAGGPARRATGEGRSEGGKG
jgi:hypothetical protein